MDINTKLCVYAICKNESKFIDRWVASLQGEADCVVVLDTGSTDDSVEKLKKYEPFVTVKQFDYFKELGYFRFDKARNLAGYVGTYDVSGPVDEMTLLSPEPSVNTISLIWFRILMK